MEPRSTTEKQLMSKSRGERNRHLLVEQWEQSEHSEQQDLSLDAEEHQLLEKQRWVTGLSWFVGSSRSSAITEADIGDAFNERFGMGSVTHVSIKFRNSIRYSSSAGKIIGAVVEFRDISAAKRADAAQIKISTGRSGNKEVLEMSAIGYLWETGASCQRRFIRLQPNRPPVGQYYHRGGGGQHTLAAVEMRIGSRGPDGIVLITEHHSGRESYQVSAVTLDLQKREMHICTSMDGQQEYLLVHAFRHLRDRMTIDRSDNTLTFTASHPPKVLQYFNKACRCCGIEGRSQVFGPEYQLAADPTAHHAFGMQTLSYCSLCTALGFLHSRVEPDKPLVGSGLAGADGLLGRCLTCKIQLDPRAVQELSADGQLLKKLRSFRLVKSADQFRQKQLGNGAASSAAAGPLAVSSAAACGMATTEGRNLACSPSHVVSRQEWETEHGLCRLDELLKQLHYLVGYQVRVLLSSRACTIWQVTEPRFVQLLQQASTDLACQALAEMAVGGMHIRDAAGRLEQHLLELIAVPAVVAPSSSTHMQVCRVHVTPTGVTILPPEVQIGNRVLRHFCRAADTRKGLGESGTLSGLKFSSTDFLQVTFGDEHGDRMLANRDEEGEAFYSRMHYVLQNGIVVNGQHFEFLAYSSSQLKSWSCWMVAAPICKGLDGNKPDSATAALLTSNASRQHAPDPAADDADSISAASCDDCGGADAPDDILDHPLSVPADLFTSACGFGPRPEDAARPKAASVAHALRDWLGDAMQTELVPAKCAARLGQAFAATFDGGQILEGQSSMIQDIHHNGHCFSDGVGRISPLLLDKVLQALPFDFVERRQVSAIQIRWQGCKGVLSRYSPLSGPQLQYRPSMKKFGSQHPQLEVCQYAAWLPAYLNRQVIIMMNYNGVEEEVFLTKLEQRLDELAEMCQTPAAAYDLLPKLGGIEPGAQRAMVGLLSVMNACNISTFDPFLKSCIEAVAMWQVTDLKNKARLFVHDGAVLMGVLDEYNVLQEDEVFVQVQPPPTNGEATSAPLIITGDVILAKHPVAHRGDVRTVKAVDPRTQHGGLSLIEDYTNVVVFSQQGHRPLPNMLSGSDLDGDQYMVIWDKELMQASNSDPMDYTAETPEKVERVTVDHLIEHFVAHVKNDRLGLFSQYLLAKADLYGADCRACDRLAELHSIAVDFQKTGRPAEMSPEESEMLKPGKYPDWMEKRDKKQYKSTSVLGKMYVEIKAHPFSGKLLGPASSGSSSCTQQSCNITRMPSDDTAQGQSWISTGWPSLRRLLHVNGISPGYKGHLGQARLHFADFENNFCHLMNNWGVYSVGELFTGCLSRWQNKKANHHQQSEERDRIRRQVRDVFDKARTVYLHTVLLNDGVADELELPRLSLKQLEATVMERSCESTSNSSRACGAAGSSVDSIRLQLAAAYMSISNKQAIKEVSRAAGCQPAAASVAAGPHQAAEAAVSDVESTDGSECTTDSSDGEASEGEHSSQDEQDRLEQHRDAADQHQHRAKKARDIRCDVRLCFQMVVTAELQEIARQLNMQI